MEAKVSKLFVRVSLSSRNSKVAWAYTDDHSQWFLISMCVMIPIASQHNLPLTVQRSKSVAVFYSCVIVIFLITGCTLDSSVLARNYKRWKTHIYILCQCFLTCSALMIGIVSAAGTNRSLDAGVLIGLTVLGTLPTTISSNVVMTAQANGNQELTLVETTIGNFLGVFTSPALVVMYTTVPTWYNNILPHGSNEAFPPIYRRVLKQLGLSIYVPLVVGQIIRYFYKPYCDLIFKKYKLNKLGSVAILVILWSTYDQAFATGAFSHINTASIMFMIFTLIGIWAAWFSLGFGVSVLLRYPRKDVIAITYCVAAKGPAIGVPLVDRIWETLDLETQSKIQVPIAIYQTMQIAFGSLMVSLLRRYIEREEVRKEREKIGGDEESIVDDGRV
ncbi:Solute carrier RCH1 [Pseudocercospora fuligena]|uniref:Solute carrier RCH1 n=1 Tax=Pseudocercospora fuligena TaxID=685502 RepID=A0A8H6VGT6_9PEZI|nr:Solute carrier RCH1 [Pseudocercospora fuligena]